MKYLSSPDSSWDHIIVGWTGEVEFLEATGSGEDTPGLESTTEVVEGYETSKKDKNATNLESITEEDERSETSGSSNSFQPQNEPEDEGLIEYYSKERLERQLYHAELKTVPV